jgi:hypothetical protein
MMFLHEYVHGRERVVVADATARWSPPKATTRQRPWRIPKKFLEIFNRTLEGGLGQTNFHFLTLSKNLRRQGAAVSPNE